LSTDGLWISENDNEVGDEGEKKERRLNNEQTLLLLRCSTREPFAKIIYSFVVCAY
jgi:hypothetical protein